MKKQLLPLALVIVGGWVTTAQAVSLVSTLGQFASTGFGMRDTVTYLANDFLTGSDPTSVTSFSMLLSTHGLVPRTVIGEIWSDNGGKPGSLLDTFDTPISAPAASSSPAVYSGADAGISLAANTIYWFVFHLGEFHPSIVQIMATDGQDVNPGGLYSGVASTANLLTSPDSGASWPLSLSAGDSTLIYELAGNITGPTSVPDGGGTLSLLGLAFAGLAWFHRCLSKQSQLWAMASLP